jgi:hypothetical protein
MLEDDVIGPLYKTIMTRPPSETFAQRIREAIRGPSPFSVSKINQIISLYVTGLWLILMYKALPTVSISAPINWGYAIVIGLTMVAAVSLLTLGKAYDGSYRHIARQRDAEIVPRESGT